MEAEGMGLSKCIFGSLVTTSNFEAKCFVVNDLDDSHLMSGVVTYSQE